MKLKETKLSGLLVFEPEVFPDDRGIFYESFNRKWFDAFNIEDSDFVQDNISHSKMGVLRGMHFQTGEYEQAKLVQVLHGEVFDVAVDIRRESSTYGLWQGEYLSSKNHKIMYIPNGFAHGFLTTTEDVVFHYKCTNFFSKDNAHTINYADRNINISWPMKPTSIVQRDADAPSLREYESRS